jgi:hypothetical protein
MEKCRVRRKSPTVFSSGMITSGRRADPSQNSGEGVKWVYYARMSEARTLFEVLRQSVKPKVVDAFERLVRDAPDRKLCRVNALAFAAAEGLDEEDVIAGFMQAARLGVFELSWNVLCPGCGGVLDAGTSLKSVQSTEYTCALCAAGYEPTLDEMVEVTFTVSPRVRTSPPTTRMSCRRTNISARSIGAPASTCRRRALPRRSTNSCSRRWSCRRVKRR